MTNDQLLFTAGAAAVTCDQITAKAWADQVLPLEKARELKHQAQALLCAAVELENRAIGNPPPKEG